MPYNSIFGEVVLPVLLDPVANDLCGTPVACDEGANEVQPCVGCGGGPRFGFDHLVGVETHGDNNPYN